MAYREDDYKEGEGGDLMEGSREEEPEDAEEEGGETGIEEEEKAWE